MKLLMFSVYDNAVKAFITPFFLPSKEAGIRAFRVCANTEGHSFRRSAEDYTLFCLGEWDDATGVVTIAAHQESLGGAITYRTPWIDGTKLTKE